ncbi:unnamed protein product, partial [Oikopleura dioica]
GKTTKEQIKRITDFLKTRSKAELVTISAVGITGLAGYFWVQNKWKYWQRKGIVGPKPTFADLGNTMSTFSDLGESLFHNFSDDVIGIYFFGTRPCLIVKDPLVWKDVCIKGFQNFTTVMRGEANYAFGKMAADFMTTAEGRKWKRLRNTIGPFFSGARLKETCLVLQDTYEHYEEKYIPKTEVEAKEFSAGYTLRSILGSGYSLNAKENEQLVEEVYRHSNILFETSFFGMLAPLFIPRWLRFKLNITSYPNSTDKFFREVIAQIMAGGNDGRINLVSLMAGNIIDDSEELTATKGFTKNEIVAQALLFQLAGQDTTATVLSFLLFSLSKTPSIQNEIHNMVKNADLSYDGLKKIKLIDACIKETQRLFTFIALLREADHDCEVAGVKVSFLTLMTHKRMKLRLKREILSCSCLLEFIKVENSMKSQKNSILIVLMEMNRTLSKGEILKMGRGDAGDARPFFSILEVLLN